MLVLLRKFRNYIAQQLRFGHSVATFSLWSLSLSLLKSNLRPSSTNNILRLFVFLRRDLIFGRLFKLISFSELKQKECHKGTLFVLMAGATRLELATSCVTGMHSNQLNYAPTEYSYLIYKDFLNCNTFFYVFMFFLYIVEKSAFKWYNFIICLHKISKKVSYL